MYKYISNWVAQELDLVAERIHRRREENFQTTKITSLISER